MAIDASTFKKPGVLILAAVAVVGGIFISSRIKKKQSNAALPPTEVTPSVVSVVGASNVEQQDATQRSLADAQQKLADMQKQSSDAQQSYQDSLQAGLQSDRDAYNQKLADQGATLGNQFTTQINSLQAYIAKLEAQIQARTSNPTTSQGLNPIKGGNAPADSGTGTPLQSSPASPSAPANPVELANRTYPGLGLDYKLNCDNVPKRNFLTPNWDFIQNDIKSKGMTNTSVQRELAMIAVSGTADKGVSIRGSEYGHVTVTNTNRIFTNAVRIYNGLRPLSVTEFDSMQQHMLSLWNGDEHQSIFQSGGYAKALFDRWNVPYQCSNSTRRF